jgi:hypothetical protein
VPHAYVARCSSICTSRRRSLKEKRKELFGHAQLRTRLASPLRGRRQDTCALDAGGRRTSGSFKQLAQAADHVEAWLLSRYPEGVRVERSLTSFEDAGGIG